MTFRIDDLSIRLMPPKNEDEERGRPDKCKHRTTNPDPRDTLGQNCNEPTAATQRPVCPQVSSKQATDQGIGALALLQAQLRAALAPPPM